MTLRLVSRSLAVFASIASLCLAPGAARAQVAGENINMVSGTQWPGGDPFLQRQNEPTMAVSSVNAQHLMAGANDYRSVDVPDPAYGEMAAGDAWLGVFKSLDGGQTWKSVLLPGYPQDKSTAGLASPLKTTLKVPSTFNLDSTQRAQIGKNVTLPGAADPVMRAGTDGMFYFLGINFARDRSVSRLFLGRYIDQNNKENGDATQGTDPIRYLGTQIIARSTDTGLNGGKQIFIDKPWMVVDVPRDTTHTCTVPDPEKPATLTTPEGTKQILAGTIYVGWAQFAPGDVSSDIMLTSSVNCGVSWSTPRKLNTSNSKVNQGVALGIEPLTGRLLVAWRRVASGKQTDAIMATRANARKKPFAAPRVVAKLVNFDLGTGLGQARTQTMPSMAVSSDGKVSYVHLAWAARDGAGGPSRIWMSSAKILTPPTGDNDQDEPDDYEPETRVKWTTAAKVSIGSAGDDLGHVLTRGHQYMPSLTASQGKLALFYYDSRQDHTRRYYEPYPVVDDPANPGQKIWVPDSKGKFYKEVLGPIGDLVEGTKGGLVFGNTPGADFNDTALEKTRHTIDVRVGFASPGLNPSFSSELVSRFPFGLSGAETNYDWSKSPAVGPQDMTVWSFGALAGTNPNPVAGGLILMTADTTVQRLQQLQLNAPGYPMFKGSTAAFMGDYIDIQGQNFVISRTSTTGWAYNTSSASAPVFHAVWTSNQDVKAPPYDPVTGRPDWSRYTPVTLLLGSGANGGMLFDGGRADPNISNPNISNTPVGICDPASTGSRDQNIYTARITEGLQVSTPQNSKFLNGANNDSPVGFVIAASNSTGNPMTVTFGAPRVDPAGVTPPEFSYTTNFSAPITSVSADIAPYSSVYRTLFVRQGSTVNSAPTLLVTVTESANCGKTGMPACRFGSLTFNPPIAISSLVAPEGATDPAAGEAYAATIGAPNISNPNISNPNISNPNISNPNISNPNISNPNISNPNISNPNISNPNISNPNISNPNISNPNISNPNISNPNISNSALSDASYTFTNTGNTNASYFVKVVGDSAQAPKPLQLIVTKTYKTPSAVGCDMKEVAHDQLVVSVPDINGAIVAPTDPVATGVGTPNISNATLALAPGETATVTLRGYVPVAEMAKTVAALTPAPVPASAPPTPVPGNPTYQTWGNTAGNAPLVKVPTQTSLQRSGSQYTATVIFNPNLANPGNGPGGTVSFIVGANILAVVPLVGTSATFSPASPLNPGESMVASYSGDATFAGSSSNAYNAPVVKVPTQTSLTAAGNQYTATVIFNANLTNGPALPIGTISFVVGSTTVANVPLVGSTVTFTPASPLNPGESLVATYSGDAAFAASTSNVYTAPLLQVATQTGLSAVGDQYTATVIFNPNLTNTGTGPGGTITFIANSITLAVVPITGGSATFTPVPPLRIGDSMVAAYSGDATFGASISAPLVKAPRQLVLGVRAELSYVQAAVKDAATDEIFTDATVTFNGIPMPWVGLPTGYYVTLDGSTGLPYATPGMAFTVSVTMPDGQTASATGNYPGSPAFSAPANHSTPYASSDVTVSWNPVAQYYVLQPYCGQTVCPIGRTVVYAPGTSFTFPGGTFTAGQQVQVWLWALNTPTFTGAIPWGEPYAGFTTMVYVDPIAAPAATLFMIGTASSQIMGVPNDPYTTFYISVQDPATMAVIPNTELTVTLTSSANPTNVMTIPWYAPNQYFGDSWVAIGPWDLLTATITRTVGGTVVARSNCVVRMPAFANLTGFTMPNSLAGSPVTATWDYPLGYPEPQEFVVWPSNVGGNIMPKASPNQRSLTFNAFGAPPFTAYITSSSTGTTCDGNGSGNIGARTDDNVHYPVSVVPPIN